jgi:dienelactone hydrolase
MLDFTEFFKAPVFYDAPSHLTDDAGVKGIFLDGATWRGKKSRLFAWIGLPKAASSSQKVPGIVLVHGGGGTAYSCWVKMWNECGFAAIALDIFCQVPPEDCRGMTYFSNQQCHREEFSGPSFDDKHKQLEEPLTDQWPFHAMSGIIAAHSHLRSLKQVDPNKVGITGISWGGYATTYVAGIDPRFAFAIPIYGCGGIATGMHIGDLRGKPEASRFGQLWDSNYNLPKAKMPMLWVGGANDPSFDIKHWNDSSNLPKRVYRTLKNCFPHGQKDGAETAEILPFCQAILAEQEWPEFSDIALHKGDVASLTGILKPGCRPVSEVKVTATRATGCLHDRLYRDMPASFDPATGAVSASLPKDCSVAFFTMRDTQNILHTSEVAFQ